MSESSEHSSSTFGLALLSMGIVFGDIGTSPLYALKETFDPTYGIPLTTNNILGGCSSIFWVLMIVVTLKYVTFILKATNKEEGGIMAMLALVSTAIRGKPNIRRVMITLGLSGAALFYGDAVITPAISVLSAVEGLKIGSAIFEPYTVIISVIIILGLFIFQRSGTGFIARFFAPVCIVWFLVIGMIGLIHIVQFPTVLLALNPVYAFDFLTTHGVSSFLVIGAVLLVFTGAEALYADVGHFGLKAIRLAWLMVFPTLILNYFGQGALLMHSPQALENPFYMACPEWALYPMVIIATLATIIASQAVISGTYSITWQAMQLHYLPRMQVFHTSAEEMGQIYMPVVNWILLIAVLITIISFGSSDRLAFAYGIAVSGTMLTTTLLAFFVMRYDWKYSLWTSMIITIFFGCIDGIFFSASLLKVFHGGWFPLTLAVFMFLLMKIWRRGREIVSSRREENPENLVEFLKKLQENKPVPKRVLGTAIFFCQFPDNVPQALIHNLKHNKIMHQHVVFLTLSEEETPFISEKERFCIKVIQDGCYRLTLRFGFKEEPHIPRALNLCIKEGYTFLDEDEVSFFISHETLLISRRTRNMILWQKKLFTTLVRNQRNVGEYFHLPSDRVIRLGSQIEI